MAERRPYKTDAGQMVNDIAKGTPAWWANRVSEYVSERDRDRTGVWQTIQDLYVKRRSPGWSWGVPNDATGSGGPSLQEIVVPRAYSVVHGLVSRLYANRPKFFCHAVSDDREDVAGAAETAINAQWQIDAKLNREMRLCVKDCAKFGMALALSGYETDYEAARKASVKRFETARRLNRTALQTGVAPSELVNTAKRATNSDDPEAPVASLTPELDDRVTFERVGTRRVSPWSWVIDPCATSAYDWRWVGRAFYASTEALAKNPLYHRGSEVKPVTSGAASTGAWPSADGLFQTATGASAPSQDMPVALCYEIFEKSYDGTWNMYVFAHGHDWFLREVKSPYWLGCPYYALSWNDDGENLFPTSDLEQVVPQILEEIVLRTRLWDGFKREAVDVWAVNREFLGNDQNIAPLTVEGVGRILPLVTGGQPIGNVIRELPRQAKTPGSLEYLFAISQDIQAATGLGPNQSQNALRSGTSATEAKTVAESSNVVLSEKREAVEEFVAAIAMSQFQLTAQFADQNRYEEIGGPDLADIMTSTPLTMAAVQEGFRIVVQPGSMQKTDDATRGQLYTTMIQEYIADPQTFRGSYDINKLIRERAKAFGEHDAKKVMIDNPASSELIALAAQLSDQLGAGGGGGSGGSPPAAVGRSNAEVSGGAA